MIAQIELEDVSKVYQPHGVPAHALTDICLSIQQGEFAVLAGPSGSGKSTLLHIVGGLNRPSKGRIRVGGQDLGGMTSSELADFRLRRIGFVFQAYNLIPVLTAQENVEYTLLLQGAGGKQMHERARDLLCQVGLADQITKRPGEMSGGQQQRVAVARALATKPEIVLADEPTANLDSKTGMALIDLFRQLNEDHNVTFLFASHDHRVIERAGRVVELRDGRLA